MGMNDTTGEEMRQAIEAARRSLDRAVLREDIDLRIAADHNIRRKIAMIDATMSLYGYLHGNDKKPMMMPSDAFNPHEGKDRTNIYYIFKELYKGMPWEIHRDTLVVPLALTLVTFDILDRFFPAPIVTHGKIILQGFINLLTLPVERPEISKAERKMKAERYFDKLHQYENKLTKLYEDLSETFKAWENPEKDPVVKKIDETHKRTKKLSEKLCPTEENASFVAQEKALAIWLEFKASPEAKTRYCNKDHRLTLADCFDYCKRKATEYGYKNVVQFRKAVEAAQKRRQRHA